MAGEPETLAALEKLLTGNAGRFLLVRDTADFDYPNAPDDDLPPPQRRNRWRIRRALSLGPEGLVMELGSFYGHVDPATGAWDAADAVNLATPSADDDPWNGAPVDAASSRAARRAHGLGPGATRISLLGTIPRARIAYVDEAGDGWSKHPHLFVVPSPATGYAYDAIFEVAHPGERATGAEPPLDRARRVEKFDPADRRPFPG